MSCRAAKKRKRKLKESSLFHGRWLCSCQLCFQEMDPHLEQPHTGPARGGRGRGHTGHPSSPPAELLPTEATERFTPDGFVVSSPLGNTRWGVRAGARLTRERRWAVRNRGGDTTKPPNKGRGRRRALSAFRLAGRIRADSAEKGVTCTN